MTLSVMDRIKKRRAYPVTVGGDEAVHCRSLTIGELRAMDGLPPELQTAFAIGCGLVDVNGKQEFPRLDLVTDLNSPERPTRPETPEEFALRMLPVLDDFPSDNLKAISVAIGKLIAVPDQGTIVKN